MITDTHEFQEENVHCKYTVLVQWCSEHPEIAERSLYPMSYANTMYLLRPQTQHTTPYLKSD